ncbi:unnamed protein product [Orchesella dallaii]|uniref:LITAF domain-containing protein n=1 Tax=Orchesella dallaii TaxID=48710 RepID=A0ABP1RZ28_9HEXA
MSEQLASPPSTKQVEPGSHLVQILQPYSFGSKSAKVTCSKCQREVLTEMDKHPSVTAWISAAIIAICGCFCGCCIIPLCMDSCMNTEHGCPECGTHLGSHKPF